MTTIKTKWFSSAMAGAPVLSGSVGAMINMLDACLKDGFNLTTLTSLVIASNVATATKAGHGYIVNQVLELAGITGACAALNGNVRVTSVTTGTFNFSTVGLSDQTATGTITAKTASAGWEKQFSGTNLAVYRSQDVLTSRQCMRIDDTVGQYSTVRGAESYTDISTEVNGFSTRYFKKSNATDANARPWLVIADNNCMYLGVQWANTGAYDFYSFGNFTSYVTGDVGNFRLAALGSSAPASIGVASQLSDACGSYSYAASECSRSYAQINATTSLWQMSMSGAQFSMGGAVGTWSLSGIHSQNNGGTYAYDVDKWVTPALTDNGYHFSPVLLVELAAGGRMLRGVSRGLLHVLENLPVASGYSIISNVENISGGMVLMARSAGQVGTSGVPTVIAFSLGEW